MTKQAATPKQTTPGHFSTDWARYLTAVSRVLGANGFGLHWRDVHACWLSGRSIEHVLSGIRTENRRHVAANQWAGQSIPQIVATVAQGA